MMDKIPWTDEGKLRYFVEMWNKAMDDTSLSDGQFIDEMDKIVSQITLSMDSDMEARHEAR